MSDEQKLDDEAPPEIPDISSSPPPPPSEGVGDELEDDIEMDEHDDEDVAVEDEEVSVAGDDEEEIEPEPISSAPPPKRRRERAQTAPHTPVARASVQPPAGDDPMLGVPEPGSLKPPPPPKLTPPPANISVTTRDDDARPASVPPRPASGPPRPASVPPRPASTPPRPVSAPPRPASVPPPKPVSKPPKVAAADKEESPWPPMAEGEVPTPSPPSVRAIPAETDASAATSYPPPPVAPKSEPAPEPEPEPEIERAPESLRPARIISVGSSDEPVPEPEPKAASELAGAEELSDDDIAPDSVEEEEEELRDEDIAPSSEPPDALDIDVTVEPATDDDAKPAKPPPPPRRGAEAELKPEALPPREKTRRAWWEELFGEDFARAFSHESPKQITRDADFIEESLGVAKGGVVLDLACGAGHHAVELARRGYGVVGYDLSLYQLALAADVAQESSQKLNLLQGDMREMAFEEMFDGIFCWDTSFGYFEEEKNFAVAQRVFRALRPGGMFLLDVANRDFVVANQPAQTWFEGDACVCMDDMNVDFITSRLRVKRSLILDDGRSIECNYSIRLYGLHELGKLLHDVGFRVTEASGHPSTPGVFFGASSPRIIILAQRP
ncbi:MAG: methyltransferase domain-containing protein [Myxococcales bacterium]|nr:methyltransferase domain-containing protein [Myxococcales bacterium]